MTIAVKNKAPFSGSPDTVLLSFYILYYIALKRGGKLWKEGLKGFYLRCLLW